MPSAPPFAEDVEDRIARLRSDLADAFLELESTEARVADLELELADLGEEPLA